MKKLLSFLVIVPLVYWSVAPAQDNQPLPGSRAPRGILVKLDGTLDLEGSLRGNPDPTTHQLILGRNVEPHTVPANVAQQTAGDSQLMAASGDENWDDQFSVNGMNDRVMDLKFDASGNLYAGGMFTSAGGVAANGVAKWDGTKWSALGTGLTTTASYVYAYSLACDGNTSVYAGGYFTTAGGVSVRNIAKWDVATETWSAVGDWYNVYVYDVAVGPNGDFYAAGYEGVPNHVAKWDGVSWSTLGSGMNSTIATIAVDGNDNVYAGGSFNAFGPSAVNKVGKWDGNTWSDLGSGTSGVGAVTSVTVDGSGNLYVGGWFAPPPFGLANQVAKWDGSTWTRLGTPMDGTWGYTTVYAVAVDGNGDVYAGGTFSTAGGVDANRIAKWDHLSGTWSPLGEGMNGDVRTLAVDQNGILYAGGDFTTAGGVVANRIAKWDGTSWLALGGGNGMDDYIRVLAVDSDERIYAAGNFSVAGEVSASHVAKWDGAKWSALGSGVNSYVNALAPDGNGNLYAGGYFTTAGGTPALYLAKWDGANWAALGSTTNAGVLALAFDGSGNLYAGGLFTNAGGIEANRIAQWDGTTWFALGNGLNSYPYALALDQSGHVYAGGNFTTAGEAAANYIAKWDGANWSALGSGMNGYVSALTFDESGNLYAAGFFTTAGGVNTGRVAKWDGNSWSALGDGIDSYVSAFASDGNGGLYLGGSFLTVGGISVNRIARWDGTNWAALGSGANNSVSALVISGGKLFAGGNFIAAGDKPSYYFGSYTLNQPPIANAGLEQTVVVNEIAQLDGSGSSDPDGDPLTYAWGVASQPTGSHAALSTPYIVNPTFIADMAGEYRVSLIVNDGTANSTPDEVIITVITAQEATQNLIDQVQALNKPQGNGLVGKLNVVIKRLDDNRIDKAIEMLQQFIDQVNVFIGNGTFTTAEGQPLIDAANAIIAALSNPAPAVAAALKQEASEDLAASGLPTEFQLAQNYPNPFNPTTTIQFSVPRQSHVRLKVYNSIGSEVATLVDQQVAAGTYKINWNASSLASGIYVYRLVAEGFAQTRRLLLMK